MFHFFRHSCVSSALFTAVILNRLAAQDFVEINPPTRQAASHVIALTGARLIDGMGGPPVSNATVLVDGSDIVSVGSSGTVVIPTNARIVDLTGKTIVPGFVDCHFHSINDLTQPRTFLKNGVTCFRDPGHPFHFYQAVEQAQEPMPRVFLCGGHIDAYPPIWPDQAMIANSAERAAEIVAEHKANGATAIKIYFRTPLEFFGAICAQAEREGIPVTAHLELVKASDAIAAGIDGLEHVTSFGTSLAEQVNVEEFVSVVSQDPGQRNELRYRLWSKIRFDGNPRLDPLLSQIVEHRLFVSPTLAVFERRSTMRDAQEFEVLGFANMLEFIRRCHAAQATLVAGSHTWVPGADFGWAFQRELELLVECGLTPLEAITAGTINGARFLRSDQRLGSIASGKLADLVVLGSDPTDNISATRDVERVMLNGQWLKRD